MRNPKYLLPIAFAIIILLACRKGKNTIPPPRYTPLHFNLFSGSDFNLQLIPKKLKVKVLDQGSSLPVQNAMFYVRNTIRKVGCLGLSGCDSLIFEDSVTTNINGEALINLRGEIEVLREVANYWHLPGLTQRFYLYEYDSVVFKLWPEGWAKIEVKNVNRYRGYSLFAPKLQSQDFNFVYQPFIAIHKDTTIIQRILANQHYTVTLNLYKDSSAYPPLILGEFNQFVGRDTATMALVY